MDAAGNAWTNTKPFASSQRQIDDVGRQSLGGPYGRNHRIEWRPKHRRPNVKRYHGTHHSCIDVMQSLCAAAPMTCVEKPIPVGHLATDNRYLIAAIQEKSDKNVVASCHSDPLNRLK